MNSIKTIALTATLLAATAAQASFFHFDHDSADLIDPRASMVFGAMDWSQQVGADDIKGHLTGQLTWHGPKAGCAKVRVIWRNNAGAEIAKDLTGTVCSNTSAPSLPSGVSETFTSGQLRKARVELLIKEANKSDFRVAVSRPMNAGDN